MFCQYYYLLISVPLSGDMSHANLAIQREKDTEAFLRVGKRIIHSIRNCALEEEIVEGKKLFSFRQRRIEKRERSERSSTIGRRKGSLTRDERCREQSVIPPFRACIKTEGGKYHAYAM